MQRVIRRAIIVAPDDQGVSEVFGVPALRRLVTLLSQLNIEHIHVVCMNGGTRLKKLVADLTPPGSLHAVTDSSELQQLPARFGLSKDEKILLMKANHVIDKKNLARFLESADKAETLILASSGSPHSEAIFIAPASKLPPLINVFFRSEEMDETVLTGALHIQGRDGLPHAVQRNPENINASERKLLASLKAQTSESDGVMARHFDRRISQFFSKRLVHTGITPNQVTLIGMSIGLLAALLLSLPGYWPHLIGSLLFVFCVVVDGVDGEIARLKLKESSFGHYLDVTTDNIVHIAIFIGMAFGLYHDTGNPIYIKALWFLLGGFALCLLAVYQCILRLDKEELRRSPKIIAFMELMSNRDFAYLIALLALFDRLHWFLLGSTVGTYLFAATLWIVSCKEKRKRQAQQKFTL